MIELIVNIFRLYTIIVTKINELYLYLYINFSLFKKMDQKIQLYKYYLYSQISDKLIEYPFNCFYVCNLSEFNLKQDKIDLPEFLFDYDEVLNNNSYELMNLIEKNSLLLVKTDDFIKCNIVEDKNSLENIPKNINTTKKHFLTVTYGHPKLECEIELDINGFFVENNEILNYIFVLRQLKYQTEKFIFDSEYYVKIIDNKCNIITINSKQYVKITNNNYEIKEIKINNLLFENSFYDSRKKK